MKKFLAFSVFLLSSAATPALAGTFFVNGTGLVSPTNVVTFDELSFPDNTFITTQFAPFGVTLNNASFNAQDGFLPRNYVTNFNFGDFSQNPDLQISFTSAVNAAAFDLVTNFGNSTINIFNGATLIDSATFSTSPSAAFYGYTGGAFDRIQIIAPGNTALEVGTVQFGAVPEPAAWTLMLAGFGLVGGAMRSRRAARVTFA